MTPDTRHRAPFELLRFTAAAVSADVSVVELEGRFATPSRFAREPVLVVEDGARPRVELAPVRSTHDGERWSAVFAVPLAALDAGTFALGVRGTLLELPAPDLADDGDRLAGVAREANALRRRLEAAEDAEAAAREELASVVAEREAAVVAAREEAEASAAERVAASEQAREAAEASAVEQVAVTEAAAAERAEVAAAEAAERIGALEDQLAEARRETAAEREEARRRTAREVEDARAEVAAAQEAAYAAAITRADDAEARAVAAEQDAGAVTDERTEEALALAEAAEARAAAAQTDATIATGRAEAAEARAATLEARLAEIEQGAVGDDIGGASVNGPRDPAAAPPLDPPDAPRDATAPDPTDHRLRRAQEAVEAAEAGVDVLRAELVEERERSQVVIAELQAQLAAVVRAEEDPTVVAAPAPAADTGPTPIIGPAAPEAPTTLKTTTTPPVQQHPRDPAVHHAGPTPSRWFAVAALVVFLFVLLGLLLGFLA